MRGWSCVLGSAASEVAQHHAHGAADDEVATDDGTEADADRIAQAVEVAEVDRRHDEQAAHQLQRSATDCLV